jgi:pimeloyl-ACP methyl ester carboxylesterase
MPTKTRDRIVNTRNGAAKVRVLSVGGGPPLVYLHGIGGLEWDAFLDDLSATHTVYAIEHVGSGESTGIENFYDIWDLVVHYEEAFDELDLTDVVLVGHSFGGMVAAEVAAHLRKRVSRLVLLAPLGLWDDEHPVAEIDAIERTKRAQALLADPTRALPRLVSPEVSDQEGLFHADLNAASINQFTWPIPDKGLRRRLYRVTAPTLLLWGDHDRIVEPFYAKQFASMLPTSTVRILPNLGHLLHYEDPGAVSAAVRDFLDS